MTAAGRYSSYAVQRAVSWFLNRYLPGLSPVRPHGLLSLVSGSAFPAAAVLLLVALSACAGKEIPVAIDGSCDFMRKDFTDPALMKQNDGNKRADLFNDDLWLTRCLPKGARTAGGPR